MIVTDHSGREYTVLRNPTREQKKPYYTIYKVCHRSLHPMADLRIQAGGMLYQITKTGERILGHNDFSTETFKQIYNFIVRD